MRAATAARARDADDHLISAVDVARILNCHPVTVPRRLEKRDDFPKPIRLGGNRKAWWRSEIVEFIEKHRNAPHPKAEENRKNGAKARRRAGG